MNDMSYFPYQLPLMIQEGDKILAIESKGVSSQGIFLKNFYSPSIKTSYMFWMPSFSYDPSTPMLPGQLVRNTGRIENDCLFLDQKDHSLLNKMNAEIKRLLRYLVIYQQTAQKQHLEKVLSLLKWEKLPNSEKELESIHQRYLEIL